MTKILRGVIHGKIIEVSEDLGLQDGQAVDFIVTAARSTDAPQTSAKKLLGPPSGWRPGASPTSAGLLAEEWTEEDDTVLEQIYAERKNAMWRELKD